MKLLLLNIIAYSFLFILSSCKKYASAPEAFFIQPGQINMAVQSNQGSASHKITDLWVYVDGFFKGVYPIENKIPIVSNGKKVKISILGGIKNNGISSTRLFWPLFNSIEFDTLVENEKVIQRDFTFSYNTTTTFKWVENFDNNGQSMIRSSNSAASTVSMQIVSSNESFENKYLELKILGGGIFAQIETYSSFNIPLSNSNVYLELNYKCNNPFTIALIGDNTEVKDVFTFNTQSNWNKAYIQLASTVNSQPVSNNYKICFYMVKTEAEEPRILLDNLKLVFL
ncbi:MAG: hypothetical protein WCR21_00480 [Bacteroidota bacterium]